MVICSCRAVSDRAVLAAIAEGASTVEDVSDKCAAASRCGGCWPEVERLVEALAVVRARHVASV